MIQALLKISTKMQEILTLEFLFLAFQRNMECLCVKAKFDFVTRNEIKVIEGLSW